MLLIHVQQVTPRVSYTFKHICKRILGVDINLTSKIENFIAHDGPKFSYGKQPLSKELYFQSVDLLFEQGLNDPDIHVLDWEETKCFFEVKNENAALPFDIFAASFYLLTRYEEYLPHVKDSLGRFPATESIGYNNDFLQDPVVDIWAFKLKKVLEEKFPDLTFIEKNFEVIPVIVVNETFVYKNKGFLRSVGGAIKDLWKLKIDEVSNRVKVNFGLKKDPYDTFDFIIRLQKNKRRDSRVLFGLGDYSNYEKNISYNNPTHRIVIKHISDYLSVGLKVSFESIGKLLMLKKEKQRMESIINRKLQHAICSFFKIKLPEAYRNFIELEVEEDYSMGFWVMFYDLDYEVQTPLKINSFCFANLGNRTDIENEETARKEIISYIEKIKKVNGVFTPVLSNVLFSDLYGQTFWKSILEFIWNIEDE